MQYYEILIRIENETSEATQIKFNPKAKDRVSEDWLYPC